MQNDPTLALNLAAVTEESRKLAAAITPGSAQWDVIVVGSGAAGGMAAFQLAMAGVKVLLLEAGRMIDVRTEYRTMEWPYASMRRHRLPPGERPIGVAEYNFLDRPYGSNPALAKYKKVASYSANTFTRNWLPDERENPTTGTPYALVRARILGGRTNFWGRVALRYGPLQFKAASSRRLRCRLADLLRRREAVLRQGRHAARLLRHQRRARASAGWHVSAALQAQLRRGRVQASDSENGPHAHPRTRRRHDRRRHEQSTGRRAADAAAAGAAAICSRRFILRRRFSIPRATPATSRSGRIRWFPKCSSQAAPTRRVACASSMRIRAR